MVGFRKFPLQRDKAFVLVQLIAAISLFAIIMVGVSSMMSETTRLTLKLNERQETVATAQSAMLRLQRELSQAFDEGNRRGETLFVARESSEGTELIFSYLDSPLKALFETRTPGVKIAAYSLERERNESTKRIMRKEVPLYEKGKLELQDSLFLSSGILSWEFEFYHQRTDRWVPEWDSSDREFAGDFPAAVRIKLEAVDPRLEGDEAARKSLFYKTAFLIQNTF